MDTPETPATLAVRLVCPRCRQALQVKPKVRAQGIAHDCRQTTLPFRGEVD